MLKLGQYTIQDFNENEVLDAFLVAFSNTYNYINKYAGTLTGTTVLPNTTFELQINGEYVTVTSDDKCNWIYNSDVPIENLSRLGFKCYDELKSIDFTYGNIYVTQSDSLKRLFDGNTALEKVEGLQSIKCDPNGSYDLSAMFKLTKITEFNGLHQSFANSVSDVSSMFQNCSRLVVANVSSVTIDDIPADNMFYGCGHLSSLTMSTFNPSSSSNVFTHGTNSITDFVINDLGVSLDLVNMEDLTMESVTNLMNATREADDDQYTNFSDNVIAQILAERPSRLIKAYAESVAGGWTYNFNFGNEIIVTTNSPEQTFFYYTSDGVRHEVTSDNTGEYVIQLTDLTSLKNLLSDAECSCIYSVDLSGLDTYGLKDISGFMSGCTNLTVSVYPDDLTYGFANVEDASYAFANIGTVGKLWFGYDMPHCSDATGMFENSNLLGIELPAYAQGCDTKDLLKDCDDINNIQIRVGNKASLDLSDFDLPQSSIQNILESCSVTTVTDSPTVSFSAATEQILERHEDLVSMRDDAIQRGWVFTNVPIEYTYLAVVNEDDSTQYDTFITDDGSRVRLQ